ncbi:MAG: bifunctional metallophosphatase/5'-nucleotidase [Elusimicrobiales bacterium]|nr:bifunctional UDP-sugar hydrolase/5'-nucleotidase [Elusimicrobiales bacterium]HOL63607.1 bifunctional UDP-sugar hydrolase/5'-nucleotidase [Elusimicrobiales bacterium]HPO94854.1 bifunctional UDP-sugar hydrolase/5'-nucleotidase [Elusimicrobiales bacterium]
MRKILSAIFLFISANLFAEKISIYHTSDVHGMYSSREAKWDKNNPSRKIGGFAALYSLIKKDANPYIVLDSGDMFQGTPEGNITKGEATIKYMNAIGYSAALMGNHDYDFGEDNLKKLISMSNFPFLGANLYYKETGKRIDYAKPWVIIEKNKKKIAILGIAGEHTKTSTLPLNVKHLDFKDEASETAKYMKEINKEKPDAIIILAHVGIDGDYSQQILDISTYTLTAKKHTTISIAKAAKNANIIFGGHNHTGLIKGWKEPETGTTICESYWGLSHVSKAVINFDDKTGKIKEVGCELIPLWVDETGEDKDILKITEEISSETAKKMDVVIGKALENLNYDSPTFDNPIGNFVTDVTRWKANADMAFQNAGGVRNIITAGDIKLRDVYQVMPFENTIVKLKMKGSLIYELIKDNLRQDRTAMHISGITVKYKLIDGKVSEIKIEKDGKPLEPEKEYTVATNNYLTSGGSGGRAFSKASEVNDTLILVRDAMIEWIKANKEIKKPEGKRFIPME